MQLNLKIPQKSAIANPNPPLRGGLLAVGALHFGASTETSGRTLQEKRGSEGGGRRKTTSLSYVLERGNTVANMMIDDVTYSP